MSHARVASLALALVLVPQLAHGDSSRPPPSEPNRPRIEPCPEEDGVVGLRRCPDFGVWGAALEEPYLIASFGLTIRRLPVASAPRGPGVARSTQPQPPADAGYTTSYAIVQQFTLSVSRHLFVAHELEISPTLDDTPDPDSRRMAVGTQLVAGINAGTRVIAVRGEIAGGIRVMQDQDDEGVLEARLRGDLWLSPWVTLGATVGTSLLDRREWMMGFYLGMHTWSFGSW